MFHELAAVVGQDKRNRKWKYFETQSEKLFCGKGGMRCGFPRESKPRVEILERDYIVPSALDVLFDGVQGDTVTRVLCLEIHRFSKYFVTIEHLDLSKV